jgi:hypothetical protein
MSVKIDVKDLERFSKQARQAGSEAERLAEVSMIQATTLVHEEAVKNTESGKRYADGIYDTGTLRRNIGFDVKGGQGRVFVPLAVPYGRRIEFGFNGADKKGRIYNQKPKPFVNPALTDNIDQIRAIFLKSVRQALKTIK